MTKFKTMFQVLVAAVMLFGALGSYQQAQAQSPAVVVVRDLTYWDATYTGYVDANRYEEWPIVFTETEDFTVTAAPGGGELTTLVVLKDGTGTEIASGNGSLSSSQPAGNYSVQIQPATGSGFYTFTVRRNEIVEPTDPDSSSSAQPASLLVGESSLISVGLVNIPEGGYTSAEFTCSYDPALVEVSGIAATDLFGTDPATAINGPASGSFIVAVAGSNGSKATTDGNAFTFSALALAEGTATITCLVRVSAGDNVLTDLPSTSVTLTITGGGTGEEDGTLAGQVFAGKAVTVELYDTTDTLITSVVANTDGTFSLMAPAGTYTVVATASGFLGAEGAATLTADTTTTMPDVTLLAGDIDGNDVIDQFDAMTLGMSYNGADPDAADLNDDGVINVLDLELLAANYRLTGPIVWQ